MQWLAAWLDPVTFTILGLMGFVVIWLSIERWLYLRSVHPEQFATIAEAQIETTRNLTLIATIGANAPYVGLLGTVLAIMLTFWQVSQAGNLSTQAIMMGLAMALKATAGGIVVAIPSMMLYNLLMRRAETVQLRVRARHEKV